MSQASIIKVLVELRITYSREVIIGGQYWSTVVSSGQLVAKGSPILGVTDQW